ncbi:MAG: methyltetrahydrofolate cobalamin methyltransferase [Planctomycetota bacterium]|jgi:5-methyltetrahydrofolate--homocysteine methyltransferase
MILIGEKINSTRKSVREAIANKDAAFLQSLARAQAEAGADYLDVNTGAFPEEEAELMEWLVQVVQEAVELPLAIDSANPAALEAGLKVNTNGKPMINSITAEERKFGKVVPLVLQYDASVLALALDDSGISKTVEERFAVAQKLIESLCGEGVAAERIFLDPLIQPVSVQNDFGVIALEVIRCVKQQFSEVKTACGLSNISFGLPQRANLNRYFLTMAMSAGLDCAIVDVMDCDLIGAVKASEALLGKDRFCKNYIKAFRESKGR